MTDSKLGLLYSDYKDVPRSWYPENTPIDLNAWAVWLLGQAATGAKAGGDGGKVKEVRSDFVS
jgi:hypothetical protein